ncbi:AraC family transcriptional regulator [Listeria costaricensis]|uniref:AraC family transcriptional regulator n=1 Tax=Listeria costaricensis TaxID=2026604 RepID=UPI000C06BA4E|nr:AraC family transcriptional regulator [Listeria costaricensis]
MDIAKLQEYLALMTPSELKHKESPEENMQIYDYFDRITLENGEQVLVFDFFEQQIKNRQRNRGMGYFDNPQFEITKHSRYSVIPIHIHSYIEMNYVYRGKVDAIVNGKTVQLREGDFCLLDTEVPHTIGKTTEADIIINFLMQKSYFSTTMLSRLSSNSLISNFLVDAISERQRHDRHIIFHCGDSQLLENSIERLLCEYYEPNLCANDVIDAYMVIIFSELLRAYQKDRAELSKASNQTYIGDILQYIETHYETCTLEKTAAFFNFHPNYLSRLIKEKTGRTFKTIIQEQRLDKACFLLNHTDEAIDRIASQIGYQNHSFFYRLFRQKYGISPREYREKGVDK